MELHSYSNYSKAQRLGAEGAIFKKKALGAIGTPPRAYTESDSTWVERLRKKIVGVLGPG